MKKFSQIWQKKISINGIILLIINIFLLIFGIVASITGSVIRGTLKEIDNYVDLKLVETLSLELMIIGIILIIIGLIGALSAHLANKLILWFHLGIIILTAAIHGIFLLTLIFSTSKLENDYKTKLQSTMENLNANSSNITQDCNYMKKVSNFFQCCGFNGTQDFNDTNLANECCFEIRNKLGCAQAGIDYIKKEVKNLILIPSEILLIAELVSVLVSTCIICNSKKNNYNRI